MRNLSLATLFSAAAGFILMWVAGWALNPETELRYFVAFWGLFFAGTGLIDGITHETTRAVAASREMDVRGSANPWKLGAAVGADRGAVGGGVHGALDLVGAVTDPAFEGGDALADLAHQRGNLAPAEQDQDDDCDQQKRHGGRCVHIDTSVARPSSRASIDFIRYRRRRPGAKPPNA